MTTAPPSPPVAPSPQTKLAEEWLKNAAAIRSEGRRIEVAEHLEDCATELLAAVAPEPAQENQSSRFKPRCQHVDGDGKRCIRDAGHVDNDLGDVVHESQHGVLAVEPGKASSGEAAGGGVTHAEARACLSKIPERREHDTLWRYIDQQLELQGQAEREAAGLRENLQFTIELRDSWRADFDAERAQKEALRVELDDMKRQVVAACDQREALRAERDELKTQVRRLESRPTTREAVAMFLGDGDLTQQPAPAAPVAPRRFSCSMPGCSCRRADPEQAAPVAKEEATVEPVTRECPSCGYQRIEGYSRCPNVDCLRDLTDGPAPQPPATIGGVPHTASPHETLEVVVMPARCAAQRSVAKEEATAEPWVPKVGDAVTSWRTPRFGRGVIVAIPSQTLANSVDNCDVEFEDGRVREIWLSSLAQAPLEPAPQPPATTGEGRTVGPCSIEVDALRAEIVAALRKAASGANLTAPEESFHCAADELERRKP